MVELAPLNSQLAALRFPHTMRVEPSPENGLSMPSVILLFQLQVVDRRRLLRVIGALESHYVDRFDNELRSMLKL
jgi:mRNA interferase MazF